MFRNILFYSVDRCLVGCNWQTISVTFGYSLSSSWIDCLVHTCRHKAMLSTYVPPVGPVSPAQVCSLSTYLWCGGSRWIWTEYSSDWKYRCKDIAYTFSSTIDPEYVTLEMRSVVSWQSTVSGWIQNNKDMLVTDKAGCDKIEMYRYFFEDNTCIVLFREIVSINCQNLFKIVWAAF